MQHVSIRYTERSPGVVDFFKRIYGASEYIRGDVRYCLWLGGDDAEEAKSNPAIAARLERVATLRLKSPKPATQKGASWPHRFEEVKQTGAEVVTYGVFHPVASQPVLAGVVFSTTAVELLLVK